MKLAVNRPSPIVDLLYGIEITHPYFQIMTLLVSLSLLVGTMVGNVYIQHQNKLLNNQMMSLSMDLAELAALGHEIQLEEQGLNRYDRIKLIAAKQLGMADIKTDQIIKK
ncbi:cell division protein FtsL [Gammaproteobacteria bacterium]|nr:cell division protein FtsL [Gammaproteobacteria bacterium]